MKGNRMEHKEFRDFFIDELKDIYWAEQHLANALPKMQKATTTPRLAGEFEKHTKETGEHISLVEKIFEALGEKPQAKKCEAMEGLLQEVNTIINDTKAGSFTRDAGLILAAQKIEHYEIATYGTLAVLAKYLQEPEIISLLKKILKNEKKTDVILTELAESYVNQRAAAE